MSCKKQFGFSRGCGILMPISSLPSPYGIGNFGKGAYDFIDFLAAISQKLWQVLPLNPTSYGDSPYQSPASLAGNPYFIDPQTLYKKGLITKDELILAKNSSVKVDYGWLFSTRYDLLRKAFARFSENKEYKAFVKKNAYWLDDYSLFMALKVKNGYKQWTLWNENERNVTAARTEAEKHTAETSFWKWVQYEFMSQWQDVLSYAHQNGITVIGDMPIYVAHDSVDVWSEPEEFLLDETFAPTSVAGCPPDAYAEDGQLWGNPLYNWELMKNDNFSWWCKRVGQSFKLYDVLRIDHFRGFASYYSIPFGDENARRGKWIEAPGKELFDRIKEVYPKARIIAEDLGFITDDVRDLLKHTDFPGMKLLQFAFFDDESEYLPRNYTTKNTVVYPGSHDSDCSKSWYKQLKGATRARFIKESRGLYSKSGAYKLIEMALRSIGNLAIVPMQDYLELENEQARMNTPSVPDGNWSWRISSRYNTSALRGKISNLVKITKR